MRGMRKLRVAWGVVFSSILAGAPCAWAAGIYTCVDGNGRKLTSDRPIPECADREQRVLNPSGTVREKLAPPPTTLEKTAAERKEQQANEERSRADEEKRRMKLQVMRYPNQAAYDQARESALAQPRSALKAATARLSELKKQGIRLDAEMEFYRKDPTKAPEYLRRQVDDLGQNTQVVKRTISEQEDEIRRINLNFDDEQVRLRQIWNGTARD